MEAAEVELVETGAKRDVRGRVIESEAEKARLLAEYDRSGLTQRAFAQREAIRYNTFIWWLKQRRDRGQGAKLKRSAPAPMRFEEYRLSARSSSPESPPPPSPLEVCLPDGTIVRGGSSIELIALAKALRI